MNSIRVRSIVVRLPGDQARELEDLSDEDLAEIVALGLRAIRSDRALQRYAGGGISFGAAAALAGVSKSELSRHAQGRGMEPPYDAEMLDEELG